MRRCHPWPRAIRFFSVILSLSVATSCKQRSGTASDVDFGSGEHKWLGDAAFEQFCEGLSEEVCPADKLLPRKDGKESYSYGDLVAFSGDFFEKPNDIYDKSDKLLGRFHNKKYVMSHFEKQVEAINKMYHGEDGTYPSNNIGVAVSIPQYGLLALNNDDHFGWHNMVAYVRHHQAALDLAKKAHDLKKTNAKAAREKFVHALFLNAFADHFLTDGFAAGHIRVPRTQLKTWATAKRYTPSLGGTIAKVVHDFDGKLGKHFPKGLHVQNAAGQQWASRVDAELFIRLDGDVNTVELPMRAVALSLGEVRAVYENGTEPDGIFAAAMLVPFVDVAQEVGLGEKFRSISPDDVQKLIATKDWFGKVPYFTAVTLDHMKALAADLPSLMETFSQAVQAAAKKNPEIERRLPAAYIAYFSSIK